MATPENTLLDRGKLTSIITPATGRFALVMDGQTIELGATGWRDVSALLDPTKVQSIAAGMLIVIRDSNHVTIKFNLTPSASGNVQIAASGVGTAFAPDTTLWNQGRGGAVGISNSGNLYINPATAGTKVDATLTFDVDNAWPASLPGVKLGDPVVI